MISDHVAEDVEQDPLNELKMISDLPRDVTEEVLLRIPIKYMRAVRFTCKNWNTISKSPSFGRRHLDEIKAASGFILAKGMRSGVDLMSINLQGLHKGLDPLVNHQGKLYNLNGELDGVNLSRLCHCDGLLLFIPRLATRMIVWNPYLCQTLWIKLILYDPSSMYSHPNYAIGYGENRSYKVLRFFEISKFQTGYEVYYLNNSTSSSMVTISSDWHIEIYAKCASLKGNTYWFATEKCPPGVKEVYYIVDFLICFDFKSERFGPRLSLPFHSEVEDCVTLYSVGDEKLAVLFQNNWSFELEIWITNEIKPDKVSWNSKVFLAANMKSFLPAPFPCDSGSFFVDLENKVAVVFEFSTKTRLRFAAYVIGEDGYFKEVDFGDGSNTSQPPIVISYVPSLVQIKAQGIVKQPQAKKMKITNLL